MALLVFALGAGVSLYEGVDHLRHPASMERPLLNYVVLAASFICEAASWSVSVRAFRAAKGGLGYISAFRASKDPITFIILFEDSAAMIGLTIAAAGISCALAFHQPLYDGAASIGIGLVLAASSVLLARETKGLLIGEPALPPVRASILRIAAEDRDVDRANGVLTVQMGPDQVLAALSAEFHDGLTTQADRTLRQSNRGRHQGSASWSHHVVRQATNARDLAAADCGVGPPCRRRPPGVGREKKPDSLLPRAGSPPSPAVTT